MKLSKCPIPNDNDPFDLYIQLYEIQAQLHYLGEHVLERKVNERLDQLWETFNSEEHKLLAIEVANMGGNL